LEVISFDFDGNSFISSAATKKFSWRGKEFIGKSFPSEVRERC